MKELESLKAYNIDHFWKVSLRDHTFLLWDFSCLDLHQCFCILKHTRCYYTVKLSMTSYFIDVTLTLQVSLPACHSQCTEWRNSQYTKMTLFIYEVSQDLFRVLRASNHFSVLRHFYYIWWENASMIFLWYCDTSFYSLFLCYL